MNCSREKLLNYQLNSTIFTDWMSHFGYKFSIINNIKV